jgi:hypothetical protein
MKKQQLLLLMQHVQDEYKRGSPPLYDAKSCSVSTMTETAPGGVVNELKCGVKSRCF